MLHSLRSFTLPSLTAKGPSIGVLSLAFLKYLKRFSTALELLNLQRPNFPT